MILIWDNRYSLRKLLMMYRIGILKILDGNYKPFSANGITSNFVGQKIKYVCKDTELLQRGEYYWFRFRQIDELQSFDWRYFEMIIYR
jgi:hypothetical protein